MNIMSAHHRITLAGAIALSVVGIGMAAAAAVERGATDVDRTLIVACAVAITLAANLLPALSRRAAGWALWSACVALTVYGHATFFAAASVRAGTARADTVQASQADSALRAQLDGITARSLATVAAGLASARHRAAVAGLQLARCDQEQPGRCGARRVSALQADQQVQALQIEATEAEHAADLRAQITAAAAQLDTRRTAAASGLAGISTDGVVLAMSVLSAVVVELLAALLWAEVLHAPRLADQQAVQPQPKTRPAQDWISVLKPPTPAPATAAEQIDTRSRRPIWPGAPPRTRH